MRLADNTKRVIVKRENRKTAAELCVGEYLLFSRKWYKIKGIEGNNLLLRLTLNRKEKGLPDITITREIKADRLVAWFKLTPVI